MTKLTPNFTIAELTVSSTAKAHGIANTPLPRHLPNLYRLALGLQWVRHILGNYPLTITSGYRNPEVNALVGGVPNSDHTEGHAADFRHPVYSPFDVATKLVGTKGFVFDQVILETSRNIVHVSFAPAFRQQALTQRGGAGTPFVSGIVR